MGQDAPWVRPNIDAEKWSNEMSDPERAADEDPGEVEPTDNSSGALVDLDRVQELEEQQEDASGR